MRQILRMAILALGLIVVASSSTLAAQTPPTPAPDAGTPAAQPHAKSTKTKKRSAKKSARKKARKKTPAR